MFCLAARYETIKTEVFAKKFPRFPKLFAVIISACIGDTVGSLALTPAEVVKSKTQAGLFSSSVDAAFAISKHGGLRGFYQGFGAALGRDVPFRAIQLSLYEFARSAYSRRVQRRCRREMTAVENLVLGALTGMGTAAATTPLDVVRTRMMSQSPGSGTAYVNAFDCAVRTAKLEGVGALYKGIVPRVALIGPSAAVFFVAYEASKKFFRTRAEQASRENIKRY